MICSAGGVGKDFLVERLLKARRLPLLYMDTSSEAAMVKFAWRHRHARVVIVHDNAKMLHHQTKIDRLKHMLDNPARLHYETDDVVANMKRPTASDRTLMLAAARDQKEKDRIGRMALRDEDMPEPDFEIDFGILWSSNVNYTVPANIPPVLREHWRAFEARGLNPRWIPDTPKDLFVYSLHLILECSMLRGLHLKLDDANAVLRVLIERRGHLRDVSPRGVRVLAQQRQNLRNANRLSLWERELEAVLAASVVQPALAHLDVPLFQIPVKGGGEPLTMH